MTDVEAVRAGAVRLRWAADSLRAEADRIDRASTWLACHWRGTAADAALAHLAGLAGDLRALAEAHERAGEELLRCAGRIEHAQVLARQEDARERQRALTAGPSPLGIPYWREQTGLLEESDALERAAVSHAVAALRSLTEGLRDGGRTPSAPLHLRDHVIGFGKGLASGAVELASLAWLATGLRGAYDHEGLQEQERDLLRGLQTLVAEPTRTVPILLGIDVLQEGRYGEWAGSVLPDLVAGVASGGLAPALRRGATGGERLAHAGGSVGSQAPGVPGLAPPRPDAGGPVVPARGALLTVRVPASVVDLTVAGRARVLADSRRSPALPPGWTDDQTVAAVMQAATQPLTAVADGDAVVLEGRVDGVSVRVRVDDAGVVDGVELLRDENAAR